MDHVVRFASDAPWPSNSPLCQAGAFAISAAQPNYEELQAYMADVLGFSDESIATVFEKLDLNSDGVITREELANTFVKYSAVRLALRPW